MCPKRRRGLQFLTAGRPAEYPELFRRTLVAVDEVVQLELVDLASVKLGESFPDMLEQPRSCSWW